VIKQCEVSLGCDIVFACEKKEASTSSAPTFHLLLVLLFSVWRIWKGKTLDVAVVLCAFVALKVAVFAGLLWVYFELWEEE
jgi:hypothetical protein